MGRASGHAATEPAVDGQADAHDVGGIVRRKEEGGLGDVSGRVHLAGRAGGVTGRDHGVDIGVLPGDLLEDERRIHQAGHDRIHADAVPGVIQGKSRRDVTVALNFCSRTCW